MPTGTVKWFDPRREYGYIIPDDGGQEVFVHQSQLQTPGPPDEGQPVTFELQSSPKGPIALSVRIADV